jgi:hypothetical protein
MIRFHRMRDGTLILAITWRGVIYEWMVTRFGLERL